jgi:hypothetical protein
MPYGVASPNQLKMMADVLDAFCHTHHIPNGADRDAVGDEILKLFNHGHRTAEDIRSALGVHTTSKMPGPQQNISCDTVNERCA